MAHCFAMFAILAMSALKESYGKRADVSSAAFKMMTNSSDNVDDELFKIRHQTTSVVGESLKLMSLNVEFFHEMCDKKPTVGMPECLRKKDVDIEFKVNKGIQKALKDMNQKLQRPVQDKDTLEVNKKCTTDAGTDEDERVKISWKDFLGIQEADWPKCGTIKLTIPDIEDVGCKAPETQKRCCNSGGPLELTCRLKGKCYDVGHGSRDGFATWPSYDAGDSDDKEPKCLQGSRELLEKVVKLHEPDVVATQEDFENYPLEVEGYTTIISADSHAMWFKVGPQTLSLKQNSGGKVVHMVNALLVKNSHFNLEQTEALCKDKPDHVFMKCGPGSGCLSKSSRVYRCGVDLRSPAAAAAKKELDQGYSTLNGNKEMIFRWKTKKDKVFVWKNNPNGQSESRQIGDSADKILLMASRCAALAAVGQTKPIIVASVHLTGGRFDDDLIGIEHQKVQALQVNEKIEQVRKLVDVLEKSSPRTPKIIMGDFNGPDDFDIQWWKVLTTTWPNTHPALGHIFEGKAGLEKDRSQGGMGQGDLIRKATEDDATWLPRFHTGHAQSVFAKDHPKFAALQEFEANYKHWMVGMHEELTGKLGWTPMLTSKDMTNAFTKELGTTSKFGGTIDFFYASPGFIKEASYSCKGVGRKEGMDFAAGDPHDPKIAVNVKKCTTKTSDEGTVKEWNVDVVKGVLKRSTDHAPVLVEMQVQ